jgi:formylglycine-generating enzyme required for sulfatase activity
LEYSVHHPQSDLLVRIPGGTFVTGTIPVDWLGGNPAARLPHQVTINSFEMDRTEVTVTAYEACVHAGACWVPETGDLCNWGKPDRSNHPINCVTWHHASQYCCWAGKRLPSELEWEYAARGADGRTYPWGNDAPQRQLCWNRGDSGLGTCAVGTYTLGASPYGLLDVAGNVWEWTSTADNESQGTDSFIIRGGSWFFGVEWCFRVYVRGRRGSMEVIDDVGFRCAR